MPDDVEILVSDRHLHDDAALELGAEFANDSRVRIIRATDQLNWVSHADFLLHEARGIYWRFLPHDDISPPGAVQVLSAALDSNPEAVLSYGQTVAINASGHRIPYFDHGEATPSTNSRLDQLDVSADLFWFGYSLGAFKGLVRRDVALARGANIRATPNLMYSDRAWLFALKVIGPFVFVQKPTLVKRYMEGTVTTSWGESIEVVSGVTETLCKYADDLLADKTERDYIRAAIHRRMHRRLIGHSLRARRDLIFPSVHVRDSIDVVENCSLPLGQLLKSLETYLEIQVSLYRLRRKIVDRDGK